MGGPLRAPRSPAILRVARKSRYTLGNIPAVKAAYIETTGSPDAIRYGDLPKPAPQSGEVLVRVGAVAVNPIDLYIRAGTVAMPLPKPFIVGCDLAGTVEAVGAQASRFKVGDRVWGSNQGLLGRQGTFAEYAAVQEEWLYPTPAGVDDPTAAATALVGITAHLGLFRDAQLEGRRNRLRQRRHRRRRLDGRADGQGGRGEGRHHGRLGRQGRAVPAVGRRRCAQLQERRHPCPRARIHARSGRQRLVRDAARAGLPAHRGPDGPARPYYHHGGAAGTAGLSGGSVLCQGLVAARLRHVQRHRRRAAPTAPRTSTAGSPTDASSRSSVAPSRWRRPPPPISCSKRTRWARPAP